MDDATELKYPMSNAQALTPASSMGAARWLEDHGDVLYGYALRQVRNTDVAEDLVQDTLLAALASSARFAGRSTERTWLIGILKHKVVDHLRKSIRQHPLTEFEPEDKFAPFTNNGHWKMRASRWQCDPHQTIENAEFQKVLAACLSKLPPRIAQVFWLYEAESMGCRELCEELEISSTNVWTMLHRARLRLQACLTSNWFESSGK